MFCKRAAIIGGVFAAAVTTSAASRADPLRLRGDALVQARSPTGLVVLQGEDAERPWVSAEALVWTGAGVPTRADAAADVLVLAVRLREPHGLGEVRAGRFVFTSGAIRPVQIDGVTALGRTPWGTTVEPFVGAPVVPAFGARPWDWTAGGRVAQAVGSRATIGASYMQERAHGDLSREEIGADAALVPVGWLDVAARSAYGLAGSPGIADALVSAAARAGSVRVEVFGTERTASRLLPATSLFSVLGNVPSRMAGSTARWRAAPRLDLLASAALQQISDDVGMNAWLRSTLRLDDEGAGQIGLETRRQEVGDARWTGVRVIGAQPLGGALRASTEMELVVPDAPRGRGAVWPWGLAALGWRPSSRWDVAAAIEASSGPQNRVETDALVRVSGSLEAP